MSEIRKLKKEQSTGVVFDEKSNKTCRKDTYKKTSLAFPEVILHPGIPGVVGGPLWGP